MTKTYETWGDYGHAVITQDCAGFWVFLSGTPITSFNSNDLDKAIQTANRVAREGY